VERPLVAEVLTRSLFGIPLYRWMLLALAGLTLVGLSIIIRGLR
jgi:hypothetical protein